MWDRGIFLPRQDDKSGPWVFALFNDSCFQHLLYFDLYFITETVGRSVEGSIKFLFGFKSGLFNQIRKKVLSPVDLLSIARHLIVYSEMAKSSSLVTNKTLTDSSS